MRSQRVTLVQGNEEVAPGVFFEPMFGHTAGHVMVAIAMGSQKAYNIGDVVVQPLFIEHPEWSPAIDMEAGMADVARRRFFAQPQRVPWCLAITSGRFPISGAS